MAGTMDFDTLKAAVRKAEGLDEGDEVELLLEF